MGNPSTPSIRRRRRRTGFVALGLLVPLLALPARAEDPLDSVLGDPGRTYPNLVPNVEDVQVQNYRIIEGGIENGLFLWFDTRAQNLGDVPVQVTIDEVETPETSTVSQCISWRSAEAYACRETELVGGYTWHDAHRHFHYQDFAAYELRKPAPDGRADYSDDGLLRVSSKVSFCFYDIEQVPDQGGLPVPFYTTGGCVAPVVMGVSPGWTDIYGSDLEGQNLDIGGLPNGRYVLITNMDYENTLYETDDDDNYIEVTIEIFDSDDPTHTAGRWARIVDKRWPTPAERMNVTTTSSTTTTTVGVVPTTTPEQVRGLVRGMEPALPTFRPLSRRGSAPSRSPQCPQSCTRSWARP